jgi:hypothetical protein
MTAINELEPLLSPIAAVQALIEQFDNQRIAFWVRQFAELLEMPELWEEIKELLQNSGQ